MREVGQRSERRTGRQPRDAKWRREAPEIGDDTPGGGTRRGRGNLEIAALRRQPGKRGIAVVALIVLAGITGIGCAASGPLTHVKTRDNFTIAVDFRMPGESAGSKAPLVVLCHQVDRDRRSWDPLVPELLEKGYAVLQLDHRGFGESRTEVMSPLELKAERADTFHEDILAAIKTAGRRSGVDGTRVALVAAGFSVTYAARVARLEPKVKALVLLSGYLQSADEDYLIAHPQLPVFFTSSTGDTQGLQTVRQHAARLTGDRQELIEVGPTSESDSASWRGTDGLTPETGLIDLIAWKLGEIFPVGE